MSTSVTLNDLLETNKHTNVGINQLVVSSNCNNIATLKICLYMSFLAKYLLQVCIMDQANDLIGSNPLIGCCVVGPKESGPERDHWLDMIQSPRKAVACWHTMR